MNIKMNAVAITIMATMTGGLSAAHADFNETPYVTYLSGDDFDMAFTEKQQPAVLKGNKLRAVVRVTDASKEADSKAGDEMTAKAEKTEQNASAKLNTEVPAQTKSMQVKSTVAPGCPAEEIGYIAPCL